MTDNRTTKLLCKLLKERGVSCQTDYLHAFWRVGPKLYDAMDNLDGTLTVDNLTPEQAIAATLGSGTLTAEQVMKIASRHQPDYCSDTHVCFDWQAIADDLNERAGRTCEPTEEWCCDHCGADLIECNVGVAAGGGAYELDPPILVNYCPNCGAKVRYE